MSNPPAETVNQNEQRYKELADSFPQAVAEADEKGNMTFANANGLEMFGYTKEDFNKGLNILQMLVPEDRARAQERMRRIFSGEKVGGGEYTALKKDGTTFPVTIYTSPTLVGNRYSGLRAIVIDATEKVRAEKALKESEERYRSIFENAIEGMYQSSPQGRYITVNPALARMHGFKSPQEMITAVTDIGTQIFMSPEARKEYREILEKEDAVVNFEFELYRKDRSRIWVSTSARVVRDKNGDTLYYEGKVEDITIRKRAEEERERLVLELKEALSRVKVLSGMLPICSSCKRIENEKGQWEQMEVYIRDRSEADFSHGVCPECAEKLYPEFYKK